MYTQIFKDFLNFFGKLDVARDTHIILESYVFAIKVILNIFLSFGRKTYILKQRVDENFAYGEILRIARRSARQLMKP